MTSEQFTYWLQGYFELGHLKTLDEKQVQIIKDHLNLVFKKVTPDYAKLHYMGSLQNSTWPSAVYPYDQPLVTC
jgi:hypothetical protein